MRISSSDRGIEQAIVTLKKGAQLLRCGRRGKPEFCHFRLSTDEKVLIWYSGDKEKHLKLNSVTAIISGQRTVNFLRQCQPENDSQSFSLVYQNGERSLDLICKDRQQAESWLLGLTALVSISYQPRPLTNLKKISETHSCINSPVGHIQRKHQLGFLRDSAKNSQVRSLHGSPPRSLIERHFYDNLLDSSAALYSSKQKSFSDMQPFWNKILRPLPSSWDSYLMKERKMLLPYKISSTDHETHALDGNDGLKDVFMWGEGVGGLLGGGSNQCHIDRPKVDVLLPKLLESARMLDVKNISLGEKHVALVTQQGEVFCWGEENGGRLGHKIKMDVHYPRVVESLGKVCVNTIACGSQHTCAVTSSGELYVWGDNSHGIDLADDRCSRSKWFPHKISCSLDGICISKVACGEWHTAVLSSSGQLFTYGDGTFGVLGHGSLQSVFVPKEVEYLKGLRVKSVACGPWHTAAVVETTVGRFKSNAPCGKLYTWGDNDRGRLGHVGQEKKLLPTFVVPLLDCDFVQVSCGKMLTVALTSSGRVFTMGSSLNGQLGNPRAEDASITAVEGFFSGEVVKEISSGSSHVTALTTKGKVYTWGKGSNGRLGLGDTSDRNYPTLVGALKDMNVQSVACGSSFTAAICSHKSMSQTVCSRCGVDFRFTRKKHNCYNCGSVFCHPCSSKRSMNAALAPDKNKKFRVCDPCFSHLEKLLDLRVDGRVSSTRRLLLTWKGPTDEKITMEDSYTRTRELSPEISSREEIKLIEGSNHHNQDSFSPILDASQRWGQVSCPQNFNHRPQISKFLLPRATSYKQDLTKIDKMLKEDLQGLHNKAMILAQQCLSNSQKLQLYKCKIEEMWSVARDEAAQCKAAKDIIKLLTGQMNVVSEKFCTGKEMNSPRELSEPAHSDISRSIPQLSYEAQIVEDSKTRGLPRERMPSNDAVTNDDKCHTTSDSPVVTEASRSEWIEQDERGVYITFIILPTGKKSIKRVRFSRKHFSSKQAERWWEENQNRVYTKYHTERFLNSSSTRREA